MSIHVGILTVSDTAFANPSADKSGPAIKEIIGLHTSCQVNEEHCQIVPDDAQKIASVVQELCGSGSVDWLISTGGTGFGVRDVTPEAIAPLIERPAPGLVHLMLSSSLKHTPLAALSRPVAGTFKDTLITTLPGSVKAVKENLDALFQAGVVEHAIELIRGGSGQQVHSQLAANDTLTSDATKSDPHRHHHHHHGEHSTPKPRSEVALSHDPSAPVSARHRKSQFPQISLENALGILKGNIQRLPVQTLEVGHKLGGYVLAEDVFAPQDVPPTSTTSVDGYALRSLDPPGIYNVLTAQTHSLSSPLPEGSIYRINTGGPLPVGADTVIMVEDTELVSTFEENLGLALEEKEVKTLVQIPPGENVRAPGSDVRKGELVMRSGDRVTQGGGEVGTLAFVGRKEVKVYKKPVVAILSTGNEIVDIHKTLTDESSHDGWGGIYDTNRPSLQTVLESMGYEVVDLGIVPDDISAHIDALKKGLQSADLILTTGGTSMGPTDLLKPVIERYLDGVVHFGRVSVKPGKPTTFASVPFVEGDQTTWKPIFALPGNPASALVTFYIFVIPALRRMGGWPERMCELPRVMVQIQNPIPLDPRVEFHRVIIRSSVKSSSSPNTETTTSPDGSGVVLKAYSTGGQRSSRAASLCEANGLVVLPPLPTAGHEVAAASRKTGLEMGEYAQAVVIGEIEMEW
ncbi:molybdenum cofactor biosynthesis protein [Flammula alnicola]|nr:molybdenum cofactor biosynthesis protein [Flammula alnicola]